MYLRWVLWSRTCAGFLGLRPVLGALATDLPWVPWPCTWLCAVAVDLPWVPWPQTCARCLGHRPALGAVATDLLWVPWPWTCAGCRGHVPALGAAPRLPGGAGLGRPAPAPRRPLPPQRLHVYNWAGSPCLAHWLSSRQPTWANSTSGQSPATQPEPSAEFPQCGAER